ncbi:hypothetical protein [Desulfopila sp. IMCC35008]|uniref:hypothetical protein n=1 Tax=Desulfopila sp. IMCC35008 TaxID=2653858 RepID=UPI0013D3442A|nr:hypothetical protein [Desulfopila sp. IMCC35008]
MTSLGFRVLLICFFLILTAESSLAAVSIKGDARVRYLVKDNYLFGNTNATTLDTFDSRTRLVIEAKSSGGAFAKVRIRSNVNWGDGNREETKITPTADFAYIGVPFGSVDVEAGNMKSNITRFLEWDQSADQVTIDWNMLDVDWTGIYRILDESDYSQVEMDRLDNNDHVLYGLVAKKKFAEHWRGQANLFYADDKRDEYNTGSYMSSASGMFWSMFFEGSYKNLQLESELAFKSANTRQSRDENGFVINGLNINQGDGWGWYFQCAMAAGAFTPTLNIGIAANGYEADNDFGWIMVGNSNNEPISVLSQLGENGDWFWIAPSLLYRVSEKTDLKGNLVWVSVDASESDSDTMLQFKNLYEVSAELFYQITDSTSFTWKAGLLIPEIEGAYDGSSAKDDTAFGTYARLQVQF